MVHLGLTVTLVTSLKEGKKEGIMKDGKEGRKGAKEGQKQNARR